MKNKINDFLLDPDKFVLKKYMIRKVLKAIKNRWRKTNLSKIENAKYIAAITAMEAGIYFADEKTLSDIWHDIILGFNELMLLNQLAKDRGENIEIEKLFDITLKKLESGELFSKL